LGDSSDEGKHQQLLSLRSAVSSRPRDALRQLRRRERLQDDGLHTRLVGLGDDLARAVRGDHDNPNVAAQPYVLGCELKDVQRGIILLRFFVGRAQSLIASSHKSRLMYLVRDGENLTRVLLPSFGRLATIWSAFVPAVDRVAVPSIIREIFATANE